MSHGRVERHYAAKRRSPAHTFLGHFRAQKYRHLLGQITLNALDTARFGSVLAVFSEDHKLEL